MEAQCAFKRDNTFTSFRRKDLKLWIKRNSSIHRRIHACHQATKLS